MKLSRLLALLLCLALTASLLAGCGKTDDGSAEPAHQSLRIATTVFPVCDWVGQILGAYADEAEITLLTEGGDLQKLADCDLFVSVGGSSDAWAEEALRQFPGSARTELRLLDLVGDAVKEETLVEGMQAAGESDGAPKSDEYVWLSFRNAETICKALGDTIGKLDAAYADEYAANTARYIEELKAMDAHFAEDIAAAPGKTVLFGDRSPIRYLADDYGLAYYAAFPGSAKETEASPETVAFLAGKVDELGLPCILTTESGDPALAEAILEKTAAKDAKILRFDTMLNRTAESGKNNPSYLNTMLRNLHALRKALQ